MTNAQKNSPMLKAAGLWAKTSGKGGQYLTGRLGGLKVLILENRDRKSDDDPSHHLFFVEAPDRRQERGDGARAPQTPSASQRPSDDRRRSFQAQALVEDDAPEWAR
jgi:hypothetical protein